MKDFIDKDEIKRLENISMELRFLIIDMLHKIGSEYKGHPGGALSIADIITCLYFKILNIDPSNPKWEERDRFILSKGHACPALYAALALKGFFDKKYLYTFRHIGSMLQGHPDMRKTPGIDMTAGSLGNGLGAGVGMALSAMMDKKDYKTYVLIGDGEMQEGLIWESIMTAGHYRLSNLVAIIDRNNWQSCDSVNNTINLEPLSKKLLCFNWNVLEIDGHNMSEIIKAFLTENKDKPLAIVANTIKGKGVSFMENDNSWHQKSINSEEYATACVELRKNEYE
ncbi:MAG: transketolase [Actinobacteria bacterium]|nr:transketolase [Actinomycetota bacterium]